LTGFKQIEAINTIVL